MQHSHARVWLPWRPCVSISHGLIMLRLAVTHTHTHVWLSRCPRVSSLSGPHCAVSGSKTHMQHAHARVWLSRRPRVSISRGFTVLRLAHGPEHSILKASLCRGGVTDAFLLKADHTPSSGSLTLYSRGHPSTGTWVVSTSWLLWVMLLLEVELLDIWELRVLFWGEENIIPFRVDLNSCTNLCHPRAPPRSSFRSEVSLKLGKKGTKLSTTLAF